ncbi:MAG: MG2 domain-containing protein [Spirosomataceae bacterium]
MKKLFFPLCVGILTFFSFKTEEDLLKKLVSQLEKYHQEYPEEKAYLHTDKPYYVAGEKIWFKAYLVEATTLHPDTISIPLYVDLIDNSEGKLIDKRIIKLENGFGHGDFTLPDSLQAGTYRLRAYTNWMRNFDESLFYTKDFQVYTTNQDANLEKLNAETIDFQLCPEGGNLIENTDSRVAFKATDVLGNGLNVTGNIIASTGDTVLDFKSEHLGMGFFKFKPESGKSYRAVVKYQNIYTKTFDLPQTKPQGISMIVDNVSNKNNIRIILNNTLPDTEMYLIGQSKGVAFYAGKVPLGKPMASISIAKDKFPPGVAQFTVFDNQLRPHCERVVFIPPTKELTFNLKTDKNIYKPREKTKIEIEVKDELGNPVEGNFSMAVLDAKQIEDAEYQETILTNLLLSSDLRGNIQNPAYYFDKNNRNATYHLDILLMTQGWRRFRWNDVLQKDLPPSKYLLERGLVVSGEVSRLNGKPFEKTVNMTLMVGRDSTQQFLMGEVEKNGSFMFYGLDFRDSTEVMAQAMIGEENVKSKINIIPQTSPKVSANQKINGVVEVEYSNLTDYLRYTKDALELNKKLKLNNAIMLGEVSVKAKKSEFKRDKRVLYGYPDIILKGDVSPSALNVFDIIRGRAVGVIVTGFGDEINVTIRGRKPTFLLDGIPVSAKMLIDLPVDRIERIDILKRLDIQYGSCISVLTKSWDEIIKNEESVGIEIKKVMGYYTAKEFYMPKYDQDLPENVRPDYRSTVFWSPMIKTDKNGKASVSYFNTDAETTMRVSVEGVSYSGIPAVANKQSYSVKK